MLECSPFGVATEQAPQTWGQKHSRASGFAPAREVRHFLCAGWFARSSRNDGLSLLTAFGEALVDQDLDIDALVLHTSLSVGIGRGGMSCSIASGHKETAHGNVLGFAQIICDRCCPRRIPYAT